MSLCNCADRIYRLSADGRKPLRCALCGRRVVKARRFRAAADRVLIWLAGGRRRAMLAERLFLR